MKILPALSSHHSPILISFSKEKQTQKGSDFWKFNNSIFKKSHPKYKSNFNNEFPNDAQLKWQFIKNEIRKFTVKFSKSCAKI